MIDIFEKVKAKVEEATAYFEFRSQAEMDLWKDELTGQISDGAYENHRNTHWEYWNSLPCKVGSGTRVVGGMYSNYFPFATDLLDVVGDRMLEIVHKTQPKATEEDLRKMLVHIQNACRFPVRTNESKIIDWKCECGYVAKASDVYDEKICPKCQKHMEKVEEAKSVHDVVQENWEYAEHWQSLNPEARKKLLLSCGFHPEGEAYNSYVHNDWYSLPADIRKHVGSYMMELALGEGKRQADSIRKIQNWVPSDKFKEWLGYYIVVPKNFPYGKTKETQQYSYFIKLGQEKQTLLYKLYLISRWYPWGESAGVEVDKVTPEYVEKALEEFEQDDITESHEDKLKELNRNGNYFREKATQARTPEEAKEVFKEMRLSKESGLVTQNDYDDIWNVLRPKIGGSNWNKDLK